MVAIAISAALAFVAGGAVGLFTFKVKNRWCSQCGQTLLCPSCAWSKSGNPRRNERVR